MVCAAVPIASLLRGNNTIRQQSAYFGRGKSGVVNRPLAVLVVSAGDAQTMAMLAGIRQHCVLVCGSAEQAIAAVRRGFVPDVAMIDARLPSPGALAGELALEAGCGRLPCIALRRSAGQLPKEFDGALNVPATAEEIEQAIWDVGPNCLASA